MNLSEKSAYLKGLMDGLKLDQEAPEGKMISGIVELLQEVTGAIGDLQENARLSRMSSMRLRMISTPSRIT